MAFFSNKILWIIKVDITFVVAVFIEYIYLMYFNVFLYYKL